MSGNGRGPPSNPSHAPHGNAHRPLLLDLKIGSKGGSRLLAAIETEKIKQVEKQLHALKTKRRPEEEDDASSASIAGAVLQKAIRCKNKDIFSLVLKECGRLSICDEDSSSDTSSDSDETAIDTDVADAIIEELVSCSDDCSPVVRALIDHGFDLHGSQSTSNGRRLWFWAALKDHVDLIAYMLAAGFPIDQGILPPDQSTLGNALPSDSEILPHGISALFVSLIANSYRVALFLISHEAALRLHFHEKHDVYTVAAHDARYDDESNAIVVDAMMVLAPKSMKPSSPKQDDAHLKVVKQLLARGLDPNLPSNLWIKASSIFFMSLAQGRPSNQYVQEIPFVLKVALYGNVDIMRILVQSGGNIAARGFHGLSLLHFAIRSTKLDMIEYVAELIDDIDVQDDYGYSALHHAVALDLPDVVLSLLDYDADVDQASKTGLTPLHLAISLKNVEMCDLLLQHDAEVNTSLTPNVTNSTFNHATSWSDLTGTEMVFGSTPLMSALCPDKMTYSLPISTNAGSDSTSGASSSADSDSEEESSSSNTSQESLLDNSSAGRSRGHLEPKLGIRHRLVISLLRHGAKASEIGFFFKRRLDLANKHRGRDWEMSTFAYEVEWCFPLSLAAKTTTEAWSLYTLTSLRNVRGTSDVVRAILNAIRSEIAPNALNEALAAASFTNIKMDGTGRGHGRYSLSRPTIDLLLGAGADPNQRNNQGITLLHLACIPWEKSTRQSDLIENLLWKGAYIEARCPRDRTPLHWAAAWDFDAVRTLLGHGAETAVFDDSDRTPLNFACDGSYTSDTRSIHALLQHPHPRDKRSGDETALVTACNRDWSQESCELLHYLVEPRAPQHTNAALFMACKKDRVEPLASICTHSQLWLTYSLRNAQEATPLIEAVKSGAPELVSLILQGIGLAYRDRRLDSADTFFDQGDNVAGQQLPEGLDAIVTRAAPAKHSYSITKHHRGEDRNELHSAKEDKHFYKPPPHIEGLLLPGQHYHEGRLTSREDHPDAADVVELGPNARAACLNAQDCHGWTALHYAVAGGDEQVVQMLLEESDIDLDPPKSSSACVKPLDLLRTSQNSMLLTAFERRLKDSSRALEGSQRNDIRWGRKIPPWSLPSLANSRASEWLRIQDLRIRQTSRLQLIQAILGILLILWSFWRLAVSDSDDFIWLQHVRIFRTPV